MFTYIATNTLNGKFYIGSSKDFNQRKTTHLRSRDPYPFQRALVKNPEAFIWEVYEDNSNDPILEQALLDQWFGKEQCYNLSPKANHPPSWKGKKQSEEHSKKIGDAIKGRERSAEHCKNISKAKKGKKPSGWFLPDGTLNPEGVAKRVEARKRNGKKWTPEQKEDMSKKKQLPAVEIERRIELINQSRINLNEWGAISKVSKLLQVTPPTARHFLNKHYRPHDINNNESQS